MHDRDGGKKILWLQSKADRARLTANAAPAGAQALTNGLVRPQAGQGIVKVGRQIGSRSINRYRQKGFYMLRQFIGAAAFATAMAASAAFAAEINPAVVYDLGGKNDQSFNQSAYAGAEKYKEDTGTAYRDFEIQNDTQREQAMRRFAQKGHNPIVVIGFSHAEALKKVAPEFPETKFAIIDMVVDLPNVRSVVFKEHEGSYLVGLLAAKAAKSGKVGFVGGMDIPLIRAFACGYKQGAKAANPDLEVFENMTGTTGAAWNDPVKGLSLIHIPEPTRQIH